jgi:CheY-like chemotaxis protein
MEKPKRILLVEDSANDIELTMVALGEHNLANEVDIAHDGAEALDYLFRRGSFQTREQGNPAIVLLDLKLPKIDGFEVLRQIRAEPQLKIIPVVALTSSREEQDLIETYRLGINAYVVKPVDFHQFVDAVKKLGAFWVLVNEAPPGTARK